MEEKIHADHGSQISTGFFTFQNIGRCKGGMIISFLLGILASVIATYLTK